MATTLAIDIGGTKIAAALVDETGQLSHRRQCPTLAAEGAEAILGRVIMLARAVLAAGGGTSDMLVGVGTGGQVDPTSGRIIFATPLLPGWTGLPLRARLAEALGLHVAVANDVHVMGLGEATRGAGRGCRHLLCLAVGTGIGGAVLLDGELYQGAAGAAAGLGHISIDAIAGRRCNCGSVGCVEMYAAGPAIAADWVAAVGAEAVQRYLDKPPAQVTVQDLAALVARGGPGAEAARHALDQAGRYLGYAVTSLLHALNPEMVVVGGGVAQVGEAFFAGIRSAVQERALPSVRQTPIVPAALGTDAALIGAAELARRRHGGGGATHPAS